MKKKRLTGILALASCVALITGCDANALGGLGGKWNAFADGAKGFFDNIAIKLGLKKEEQKKDEKKEEEPQPQPQPQPEPQPQPVEVKLEVAELPELEVGESLELDPFVTVTGTEDAYTVALAESSKAVASLEGKVLTANAEGAIALTFSVGEVSQEASTSAIDPIRKAFRSFSEGFVGKDNYALLHLDYDEENESFSGGGLMAHTSKYTLDEYFMEDGDEYLPGGYIEIDGSVYSYVLEEDESSQSEEESYNPHFMVLGGEPAKLSDVSGAFGIQASDFEVQYATVDEETGKKEAAGVFADNTLFLPAGKANAAKINKLTFGAADLSAYNYTFAGAYVDLFWSETETDPDTGEEVTEIIYSLVPTYLSSSGKLSLFYDTMYLIAQYDDFGVSELDDYLASEEVPAGLSFAKFEAALDAYASQTSFTVQTKYGFFLNDTSISSAAAAYYGLPLSDCSGQVNGYVTPNHIHTEEVGEEQLSFGYVIGEDGKLYYYDFVKDEVVPVQVTEPAADVEGGFPAHGIYEMYQKNEIAAEIPVYEAAAPAEFEIYSDAGEEDGDTYYSIYVNSTEEELLAYKAKLITAGWSVISEPDPNYPLDCMLRFGSTNATCSIVDYIEDYGQYLVAFFMQSYADGHYVAQASSYADIASLPAYYNYTFLQSDVKIVDPETLEKFSVYDPIFVNEIASSTEVVNFGTEEAPENHNVTTEVASFAGSTGLYLLEYLAYFSAPEASKDDRTVLSDMINTLAYYGYLTTDDSQMSVTIAFDADSNALLGAKISYRFCWGQLAAGTYAYWGFDTTFSFTASMPELEIEFPAAQAPVQP